jgi:hypothetical protein
MQSARMAVSEAELRSSSRRAVGCVATIAIIGLVSLACGIATAFGAFKRPRTFHCDRAGNSCVLSYGSIQRAFPLDTIAGVEVARHHENSRSAGIGDSYALVLNLRSGASVPIAEYSGNDASRAEYNASTATIRAFIDGNAPTMSTTFAYRDVWQDAVNFVIWGAVFLGVALVVVVTFGRRRSA